MFIDSSMHINNNLEFHLVQDVKIQLFLYPLSWYVTLENILKYMRASESSSINIIIIIFLLCALISTTNN